MSEFISLSQEERELYFKEAADKNADFSNLIYEKDFWVCFTLKKLFNLPGISEHLIFKGGTSLSKAYSIY